MLTDSLTVDPCTFAVPTGNPGEGRPDRRSELLAAAIERSRDWESFLEAVRLREVAITGTADLDPISRVVVEHFSGLPPHQRPDKTDATAALQRIEIVSRMLRWLAADAANWGRDASAVSFGRGISAAHRLAYPHRCLAPLYFPQQSCGWRAIIGGVLAASLQEVVIRMLDHQSGHELIDYLSHNMDRDTDAARAMRSHYAIDLPTICRCLTSGKGWLDGAIGLVGIRNSEDPSESASRWEVLWQWTAGGPFIAMPASLCSDAVDWGCVERRHACICELLRHPADRNPAGAGAGIVHNAIAGAADAVAAISSGAIFSAPVATVSNPPLSGRGSIRSSRSNVASAEAGSGSEMPRCEVRMADDPGLSHSMRAVLERYRAREDSLSLLRLCAIGPDGTPSQSDGRRVTGWHDAVMAKLEGWNCGELALAFLTSQGDLCLLVGGLERSELTRKLRTDLLAVGVSAATAAGASTSYGLVAGAATVANPHRYCELDQLFAAADRCVQGALLQGRGAVKSLDVF